MQSPPGTVDAPQGALADGEVVLDEVHLRGAGLGEVHLVGVGHAHAPTDLYADSLRNLHRRPFEKDREFISAQPEQRSRTDHFSHPPERPAKDLVAALVPKRIVDPLKAIEVDEYQA